MSTIIKEPQDELNERKTEVWLDFKRLPKRKKDRVFQLLDLLEKAEEANEQREIALAITEIISPSRINLANPGSAGDPDEGISEKIKDAADGYLRHVGDAIRTRREEVGLTQSQLAEKTGLPQSHICRLEGGKHTPTRSTIQRIAKALDIEPSKLDLLYD